MNNNRQTVLIFAAHPDDETIGCGGVIRHHLARRDRVAVCIVTDGSSTQYPGNPAKAQRKGRECRAAMALLGVRTVIQLNLPDMKLDTIAHADLNRILSAVVARLRPTILYTHATTDLNLDHALVAASVAVISRPGNHRIQKVYAYEVLSSSEWSRAVFAPNTFVNIEPYLNMKIRALRAYRTELRPYPHPRSAEGVKILARYRGLQAGLRAAEAFRLLVDYGA